MKLPIFVVAAFITMACFVSGHCAAASAVMKSLTTVLSVSNMTITETGSVYMSSALITELSGSVVASTTNFGTVTSKATAGALSLEKALYTTTIHPIDCILSNGTTLTMTREDEKLNPTALCNAVNSGGTFSSPARVFVLIGKLMGLVRSAAGHHVHRHQHLHRSPKEIGSTDTTAPLNSNTAPADTSFPREVTKTVNVTVAIETIYVTVMNVSATISPIPGSNHKSNHTSGVVSVSASTTDAPEHTETSVFHFSTASTLASTSSLPPTNKTSAASLCSVPPLWLALAGLLFAV